MWGNIKRILENDQLFYTVLIFTVGAASYGLGVYSAGHAPAKSVPNNMRSDEYTVRPSNDKESYNAAAESVTTIAGERYVASKNSTKYHLPWCSGAARIAEENKVWFESKAEAEASGRTPANNCPGI